MSVELKKVTAAINTLADYFHEPFTVIDQDGREETRNALRFPQSKVLNGLCYQLSDVIAYTETRTLDDARRQLARADRANDGTEISMTALEKALERVERLTQQTVEVKAVLDIATAIYEERTGQAFVYAPKGQAPRSNVRQEPELTPMQKRIREAMGKAA